ncbi:MAG: toll/interleukin-1 receptor domain-containing protein [Rhizobiales bacterium]|nr:toll/interleukin-1 receptor domain-containing protein [Rhizobacter sp.]
MAQALKERLQRDFLGLLDIFVSSDHSTIGAGSKWLEEVDQALRGADMQIVLASAESVGRPWVNFEAGAVWLRGIPVIPVCHSGLRPDALPVPLSMLQSIAYSDATGLRKLYAAIARVLETDVPGVDFDLIATELGRLEAAHVASRSAVEAVRNPRILCAASAQYSEPQFGFTLDVAAIEQAFPGSVTVETGLTRKRLLTLLTSERFDIVHLVLPVHPDTGDLIFSAVDSVTNLPRTGDPETMSPARFAGLLVESGSRLVVLATCRALLLAVEVATVANMAASDADITGEQAAEWAECFYGFLARGRALHKAFELARAQVDVPIRAVRHRDVSFAVAPR